MATLTFQALKQVAAWKKLRAGIHISPERKVLYFEMENFRIWYKYGNEKNNKIDIFASNSSHYNNFSCHHPFSNRFTREVRSVNHVTTHDITCSPDTMPPLMCVD